MLDMHTHPSLNLRQWFSIDVITYLLTEVVLCVQCMHVGAGAGEGLGGTPHYPACLAYLQESTDSGERSPGTTGKDPVSSVFALLAIDIGWAVSPTSARHKYSHSAQLVVLDGTCCTGTKTFLMSGFHLMALSSPGHTSPHGRGVCAGG